MYLVVIGLSFDMWPCGLSSTLLLLHFIGPSFISVRGSFSVCLAFENLQAISMLSGMYMSVTLFLP